MKHRPCRFAAGDAEVVLGDIPELEDAFRLPGPFLGRHYVFYHDGRPLTLIMEVFSPRLEKYLGPVAQSTSSREQ